MAIEIGSLVVRGTFGPSATDTGSEARLKRELARLRREMIEEVQEMLAEADRRRREP